MGAIRIMVNIILEYGKRILHIPKLAYNAMNTFTYILSDYQLIERIDTRNPDHYILKFVNEKDEMVFVMWTVGENQEISVPLANATGVVMTMLGKEKENYDSDIHSVIEISGNPIYLIVD